MSTNSRIIIQSGTNAPTATANELGEIRTLEETLAGLNSIVTREGEEPNERDLARLLRELDAADSVADGVESKLDDLLKNLEGMLNGLEQKGRREEIAEDITRSEKN